MGNGGQDVLLDPLTIDQHSFLVAARTEVAGLAGEGQQVIVAAVVAVNPRKALVQVTTIQEPGQHLLFDGTGEVPGGFEFVVVAGDTLI